LQEFDPRFDPDGARARRLDARMRRRLADSLDYIAGQADGQLPFDRAALERRIVEIRRDRVQPVTFGHYYALVFAINAGNAAAAAEAMDGLLAGSPPQHLPQISLFGDRGEATRDCLYQDLLNTDEDNPIQLLAPNAEEASATRDRIVRAISMIDAANPELGAEIRAIVTEFILAGSPEDETLLVFDGAASFMLWGGVLLNATSHHSDVAMVEVLAHETAHVLLFGLSVDEPLVENLDTERYPSPLRQDPRPMGGIYHATYVTARMHQAMERLLLADILEPAQRDECSRAMRDNQRRFAEGMDVIERSGRLTPNGRRVIDGARAYMAAART